VLGRKQGNDIVYSFAYRLRRVEAILVKFQGSDSDLRVSQLGQKQTSRPQFAMSAIPSKADIG
jgi:hypothetical protein